MAWHAPGRVLRSLVQQNNPLKMVGVINALCGLLAQQAHIQAIYLSGAGVANSEFGLPDLGLTSLTEVADTVKKITQSVSLPLLVDGDTGWGGQLNIERATKILLQAGAAGMHLEDQTFPKRCGHRDGKQLVSKQEMVGRLKSAVDARSCDSFVVMARTDAAATEGVAGMIERAQAYVAAGADMIFVEAIKDLEDYKQTVAALPNVPILANITEFGKTPLFTEQDLKKVGVKIMLFPLSAFRAMNFAALNVYQAIASKGSQQSCIEMMQTREELYKLLNYEKFESKVDQEL